MPRIPFFKLNKSIVLPSSMFLYKVLRKTTAPNTLKSAKWASMLLRVLRVLRKEVSLQIARLHALVITVWALVLLLPTALRVLRKNVSLQIA